MKNAEMTKWTPRATLPAALLLLSLAAVPAWCTDLSWGHTLQKESDRDLVRLYNNLTGPCPVSANETPGFVIERPGVTITAEAGTLWTETFEGGGEGGTWYQGKASIRVQVTDEMELAHLKLYFGKEDGRKLEADALYILPFLGPLGLPRSGPPTAPLDEKEYGATKNALHVNGCAWTSSWLNRQAHGEKDVLILFRVKDRIWGYLFDREAEEEANVLRLANPPGTDFWFWDPAVSLHCGPDGVLTRTQSGRERISKFHTDVQRYELDLTLDKGGEVTEGSTSVHLVLDRPTQALTFSCSPLLVVSSVLLNGSEPLPFLKETYSKRNQTMDKSLLVRLPKDTQGKILVTVKYTAELFELSILGFPGLKDEDDWYPHLEDIDGAEFSLKASVPRGYEVVTVGQIVSKEEKGPEKRTEYLYDMKEKVRLASLLFGKFAHKTSTVEGLSLDVFMPDSARSAILLQSQEYTLQEISNCIKIYTKLFGALPYKSLKVGVIPGFHGRGFPTLLLLSQGAFYRTGVTYPDQFLAHEVAHQWWGNQVTPLTYRDTWISEALAEYASYQYMALRFSMDKLGEYMERDLMELTRPSSTLALPFYKHGPILLGSRLMTSLEADNAYQPVVYYKGAWVFLMLTEMARYTQGGMEAFHDGLKAFIESYRGQMASTADFQAVMERSMKVPLGWYFKQWIEGCSLPKVRLKARVEERGVDSFLVAEGTQDTEMVLFIPIQVQVGKEFKEYLFALRGKESRQEWKLAGKPSKVRTDPYRLCLADLKD